VASAKPEPRTKPDAHLRAYAVVEGTPIRPGRVELRDPARYVGHRWEAYAGCPRPSGRAGPQPHDISVRDPDRATPMFPPRRPRSSREPRAEPSHAAKGIELARAPRVVRGRASRSLRWILGSGVIAFTSAVTVVPALSDDGQEFLCEEAAAHIEHCCPHVEPSAIHCASDYSCGEPSSDKRPLTSDESRCIAKVGCDELRVSICRENAGTQSPC
jgi:hypothetical protein